MRKIWKIDDKERVRENINSVDQANQGIDQPNFGSIKILAVCEKEKGCRFFLQP